MMIITNQYWQKSLWTKTINIMKAKVIKTKNYRWNKYFEMIKPYLYDLINENKAINTFNELKILINMHVNFISSNDTGDIRTVFL